MSCTTAKWTRELMWGKITMEHRAYFTALFGEYPGCSCLDHLIVISLYGCSVDETLRRTLDAKRHCRIVSNVVYKHVCMLASSYQTSARQQWSAQPIRKCCFISPFRLQQALCIAYSVYIYNISLHMRTLLRYMYNSLNSIKRQHISSNPQSAYIYFTNERQTSASIVSTTEVHVDRVLNACFSVAVIRICQGLYCHRGPHNSKENALIHFFCQTGTFYCTVCWVPWLFMSGLSDNCYEHISL